MTTLLEIRDAHKRYGEQELLDGATIAISDQYKVGLIGRNGAGKSTLCRVLLGEEELDSGEVHYHPDLRLGYLRQHDPFRPGETVMEFLVRDSEQPDWRCGQVAGQFELKGEQLDRPVKELSGGWQTRVKLAALLLHEPNLLLLDEPTNFLDLRTQLLLEEFLREFRAAAVVVSHDRAFLKKTCSRTLELARGELTMFPGNVDVYLEHIEQRREHDERANAAVLAKRKQLERFIAANRANANTASQARSKAKQLERLELKEITGAESTVRITIPENDIRRGTALRCDDLAIGYPGHQVADGVHVEIEHGARTAVVGDNGQGKTTFLRTVTGSLEPLDGWLRWGYGCQIGVYAQHVYTTLPPERTVFDYLESCAGPEIKTQMILDLAGSFLFRGDAVNKKIEVLSGGERARLCLAGLLLGRYNVLVLDEPGNHLDVETVEALADALNKFSGTVVFTSHDRYFLSRVATNIVEVRDGRVSNYVGAYKDYLYRVQKEVDEGVRERATAAGPQPGKARESKETSKERARQLYQKQKEAASLERQIAKHEQRRREFEAQLLAATGPADAQRVQAALRAVNEKLAPIEQRWMELQEEIEAG
jgi:ATP-binding cassette subfamily F protein 3